METQVWPKAELQRLDRETQKILVESGAKQGPTELLYLPGSVRGGGSGGLWIWKNRNTEDWRLDRERGTKQPL